MFRDRKPISSQSLQQFRFQIRFQRKNKVGAQIASFQLHPAVIPHQIQLGDINGTANQFRPGRSGNEFHSLVKDIRHGSLNLEAVHLERPFPISTEPYTFNSGSPLISSAGGSFASSGAMERAIPNIAFIGSVL